MRAIALVFAFAEHMGKEKSPELGRNMLITQLVPVAGSVRFEIPPSRQRDLTRAFDDLPDHDEAIERLAAAAVLVLRASGLPSFGDVWRWLLVQREGTVLARVRRHAHRLAEGYRMAVDAALAMGLPTLPAMSPAKVPEAPKVEDLGHFIGVAREPCLEVWYTRHVVALCGSRCAGNARVEIRDTRSGRIRARAVVEREQQSLLVVEDSPTPVWAFVSEEGRRELRQTLAAKAPCMCRSHVEFLTGDVGRTAFLQALVRLRDVALHAAGDAGRACDAEQRATVAWMEAALLNAL